MLKWEVHEFVFMFRIGFVSVAFLFGAFTGNILFYLPCFFYALYPDGIKGYINTLKKLMKDDKK